MAAKKPKPDEATEESSRPIADNRKAFHDYHILEPFDGGIALPADGHMQKGGKQGVHTEHLGHLLAEMQVLQRSHPGARW